MHLLYFCFSGDSVVKNPPANAEDSGSIPGSGRSPGEGNDNQLQYSFSGKSHGQRSLAGYSPWGHKELDTTQQLSNNDNCIFSYQGLPEKWCKSSSFKKHIVFAIHGEIFGPKWEREAGKERQEEWERERKGEQERQRQRETIFLLIFLWKLASNHQWHAPSIDFPLLSR